MIPTNRKVDPVLARKMAVEDGLSFREIGKHFGSSDQAVSDALRRQGLDGRRIWMENAAKRREAKKTARVAAVAEKRRAASHARFAVWFPLWAEGKSLKEMAAVLGTTPTYVAWMTHMLRRRYGWFPRRIAEFKNPAAVANETWRRLWEEGLTVAQIAERVGCTEAYANNVIFKMRRRAGWFPMRKTRLAA